MKTLIKYLFGIGLLIIVIGSCGEGGPTNSDDHHPGDSSKTKNEWKPHLDANFNTRITPARIDFNALKRSKTTWVRGNFPFFGSIINIKLVRIGGMHRELKVTSPYRSMVIKRL
jgi:hypothetical protein